MFFQLQGKSVQSSVCFLVRSGGETCVWRPLPLPIHPILFQHTYTPTPTLLGEEELVFENAPNTVIKRGSEFLYFLHYKKHI